jgi:tRNA A-37 threonylcarbamoyl transferase component Bud32
MSFMKYFLYFLVVVLIALYFFVEYLRWKWGSSSRRKIAIPGIPDLSLALKNDKAREEFARRSGLKKAGLSVASSRHGTLRTSQELRKTVLPKDLASATTAPLAVMEPGGIGQTVRKEPFAPEATAIQPSALMPESAAETVAEATPAPQEVAAKGPDILVDPITTVAVVEQGQKDVAVVLTVQNLRANEIEITALQLQFHVADKKDVSAQFVMHTRVGNPTCLKPGMTEEIALSVDIGKDAPLGSVALIPILLIKLEDSLMRAKLDLKNVAWRIEPGGRTWQITSEHGGSERAGIPFSLKLQTMLGNKPDFTYRGVHCVSCVLENASHLNVSADLPHYLDLTFSDGVAVTPANFSLRNVSDSYTLACHDPEPGGAKGSVSVKLLPGVLGSLCLHLSSPQTNRTQLAGDNSVTAIDAYNNIKTDYAGAVAIAVQGNGIVSGLAEPGNIVSASAFSQGVASLNSAMLIFDTVPPDGQLIQLTASAEGKTCYSNEITMLPCRLSASATHEMIRRLLGSRKPKIWIINAESDLGKQLEEQFSRDYEVRAFSLLPSEVAERFASPPPDLIFLDAGSGTRNGFQILGEIRKIAAMEALPLLFLGPAMASENEISDVLRSGSAYLSKPAAGNRLPMSEIHAMVKDLLQKSSLGRGQLPNQGARLPGTEGAIYQIVTKVGEGGMGYIYEARRLRDQRRVIIKYLPPRDLRNITSVVRFVQEAHTVLSFHHENLVSGYDLFMDRNRCFYVMEFIEGQTLEQMLRNEGRLDPAKAVRLIVQVARALQALEEDHHLVHRDIKPANIIVTPEGLVKLVDFGIAKLTNHNLTTMGIILGTPYYLSPEQILGEQVTIQSDIYSLGATLYHIVTGEVPFQGLDVYSIIHQRLNRSPRDPRQLNPGIPRALADIVIKMMQRKANRRYDSSKSLTRDLDNVLQAIDSGVLALEEEVPLDGQDTLPENQNRQGPAS